MSEWWLSRGDGKTEGPLTTQVLVEGLLAGQIPKQSHVCAVGEQQWHLVSQIEEIWEIVDPSQSSTSVTETPWFVDKTDSGKHKLVDVEAPAEERTQATSLPSAAGDDVRRPSPKPEDADANADPVVAVPDFCHDDASAGRSKKLPTPQPKTGLKQTGLTTPKPPARSSHAPPVPKRASSEASIISPSQNPVPPRTSSPTPPSRARSSVVSSPAIAAEPQTTANSRPSTNSDSSSRTSAVPNRGAAAPASLIGQPPQGSTESAQVAPSATAAKVQTSVAPPRNFVRSQSQSHPEAVSGPAGVGPGQGHNPSSPQPIGAGLTPLGLRPQDPLSSTAPLFAGLTGLSPLPGAVGLVASRQQAAHALNPASLAGKAPSESMKQGPAEPNRPSTPPVSRNLYGASPLSGARPHAATPERKVPPLSEAEPVTRDARTQSRTSQVSARTIHTPRPTESDFKSESSVTIQPIIALGAAPTALKVEPALHLSAASSPASAATPTKRPPKPPSARSKETPLPPILAREPTASEPEWNDDDPTRFVARPAMASAILETETTRTGGVSGRGHQDQEADDDPTTLLQARVEPNRPDHEALKVEARVPPQVERETGKAPPQSPRGADLAALAAAHALGPESIVADPNQLLADVDDEAGPPGIPIVQLPAVATRMLPTSAPPVTAAPMNPSPNSSAPTALTAPPSTPPPAHNPRLSIPTIVLKPEPIVHQEATQPAVRALRKRSPFRLSYGSLIGVVLVITVASLAIYVMLFRR